MNRKRMNQAAFGSTRRWGLVIAVIALEMRKCAFLGRLRWVSSRCTTGDALSLCSSQARASHPLPIHFQRLTACHPVPVIFYILLINI